MPISVTNLGNSVGLGSNTAASPDMCTGTDATSYSNSSWTPPTSGLIVVCIQASRSGGPDTPTISGNGLTWVQIGTTFNPGTGRGLSIFGADASGSSAGVTTIDFGANTQLGIAASFFLVEDVDLSGGVASAFVQRVDNNGTGTSGTATLATEGHADNRPFSFFWHNANEESTERTDWTEIDDLTGGAHLRGVITQWRDDAFETTASASWTTSAAWAGIAFELLALVASDPVVTPSPAESVGETADEDAVTGSVVLEPSPSSTVGETADEDAVKGSAVIEPLQSSAVAATSGPVVIDSGDNPFDSALASIINLGLPFGRILPSPSVTLDEGDRSHLALNYNWEADEEGETVSPSAAAAIGATENPTIVLGSVVLAPSAASAVSETAAPTIVLGSIALSAIADSVGETAGPTVVLSSAVAEPNAASSVAETSGPTVETGDIVEEPPAAESVAETAAPTVVLGSITLVLVASAIGETSGPTIIAVAVVEPDPVEATASTVVGAAVAGSIAVTPGSSSAVAETAAPTTVKGSITFELEAESVAETAGPTLELSSAVAEPTPVSAVGETIVGEIIEGGAGNLSPASANAVGQTAVTVVLGSVTVTAVSSAVGETSATVVMGAVVLTAIASAVGLTVSATIVLGSVTLTGNSSAIGETNVPGIIQGSVTIVSGVASGVGYTESGEIIRGSATIVPLPAEAIGETIGTVQLILGVVYSRFKSMYRGMWRGMK